MRWYNFAIQDFWCVGFASNDYCEMGVAEQGGVEEPRLAAG